MQQVSGLPHQDYRDISKNHTAPKAYHSFNSSDHNHACAAHNQSVAAAEGGPTSVRFAVLFSIWHMWCRDVEHVHEAIKQPHPTQHIHIQSNQTQTHFLRRLGAAGAGAASSSSSIDGRSRPLCADLPAPWGSSASCSWMLRANSEASVKSRSVSTGLPAEQGRGSGL